MQRQVCAGENRTHRHCSKFFWLHRLPFLAVLRRLTFAPNPALKRDAPHAGFAVTLRAP
jgi:hypothetical protein